MVRRSISIVLVLALFVGAFLVLDGIARLSQADSLTGRIGRAFGTDESTINVVVAIIELAIGAIVVVSRFARLGRLDAPLKLLSFVAYIVVIVLVLFVGGPAADTIGWWINLAQYGIVLAVLWMLRINR